ncbi:MAG TPA: hypothetical protein VD978_19970 [Azospirillum sp.]|nr:hypothetical protein [Azospirillum sp.]
MQTRILAITTALSAALLGSSASFAASSDALGTPRGFSAQLNDTKVALTTNNTAPIGREERNEARKYLAMAKSLWDRGSPAQAQQFLNFARGKLGLSVESADPTVAENMNQRFTPIR